MSDLSPEEQVRVAASFIAQSPSGEVSEVVNDVKMLVEAKDQLNDAMPEIMGRVNKEQFISIKVPDCDRQVQLTAVGEIGTGVFVDPDGKQALKVDHIQKACVGVETLEGAQAEAMSAAEEFRVAVNTALAAYVNDFFSGAMVTTYGAKSDGTYKITSCASARKLNMSNFWTGLWRAQWQVSWAEGDKDASLKGVVQADVHYFEDGNVQLAIKNNFEQTVAFTDAESLGKAVGAAVKKLESEWHSGLEETFVKMSDNTLAALRRKLPITKTKFDFNRAAQHKLAQELNTFNTM